jgi:23S rRNA pseudouridine2605 synthase
LSLGSLNKGEYRCLNDIEIESLRRRVGLQVLAG